MNAQGRKFFVTGLLVLILGAAEGLWFPTATVGAGLPGYAKLTGTVKPIPGWTDLFDATGQVKDLFGGQSAAFIEDNISAGTATDMSMLSSADYVDNNTIPATNDLGNAYVYQTTDKKGNLVLFAAVERLIVVQSSSFIDFEFTQDKIGVRSGVPWEIYGKRSPGDLLVRMNFVDGMLDSVEFKSFAADLNDGAGGYRTIETALYPNGISCDGRRRLFASCWGPPLEGLPATNSEVWDLAGNPVVSSETDSFAELGVNVGRLLGFNPGFSSLTLKTPEDIAFASGVFERRD